MNSILLRPVANNLAYENSFKQNISIQNPFLPKTTFKHFIQMTKYLEAIKPSCHDETSDADSVIQFLKFTTILYLNLYPHAMVE